MKKCILNDGQYDCSNLCSGDCIARKNENKSVVNFMYFCLNFRVEFIDSCWKDYPHLVEHFKDKFHRIYNQRGTAVMMFFFAELSSENQFLLTEWVSKNYLGFSNLKIENDTVSFDKIERTWKEIYDENIGELYSGFWKKLKS